MAIGSLKSPPPSAREMRDEPGQSGDYVFDKPETPRAYLPATCLMMRSGHGRRSSFRFLCGKVHFVGVTILDSSGDSAYMEGAALGAAKVANRRGRKESPVAMAGFSNCHG
jgi:hypothetical protein